MKSKVNQFIYDVVFEFVDNLSDDDLLSVFRDYNDSNNYDNYIYSNEDYDLNDLFNKPSDLLRASHYGDYRYMDAYFCFNGYGNMDSFNDLKDKKSPIDLVDMSRWLIDNDFECDTFGYGNFKYHNLKDEIRDKVKECIENDDEYFTDDELIELADLLYLETSDFKE